MKRFILGVLLFVLISFFGFLLWPLSFLNTVTDCSTVTVWYVNNNLEHEPSLRKVFGSDTEEFSQIWNVLNDFSYHRSLRTLFGNASMEGNAAGYWLFIYIGEGENRTTITCGGTGEIMINSHVYKMGYWGKKVSLSFMEQIVAAAFS